MRFKETPQTFSDAAILALIDAWPPAILAMLKKPAPPVPSPGILNLYNQEANCKKTIMCIINVM